MVSLGNALQELRKDRNATQLRLEKLNQIISGIESLNGTGANRGNQPTEANYIGSFTAENGAGAASALGKGERSGAEAKADGLSRRQKKDRSRSTSRWAKLKAGKKAA
jgi:hypothetical protein